MVETETETLADLSVASICKLQVFKERPRLKRNSLSMRDRNQDSYSQIFETETETRKMCIFETEIETETRKMVETETKSLADLCTHVCP